MLVPLESLRISPSMPLQVPLSSSCCQSTNFWSEWKDASMTGNKDGRVAIASPFQKSPIRQVQMHEYQTLKHPEAFHETFEENQK